MEQKTKLGNLFVEKGLITQEQLDQALSEQGKTGEKIGTILVSQGFITEAVLLSFLSEQLKIPLIDLENYELDPDTTKLLSEAYARRYRAIALQKQEDALLIGMADPLDINAVDELSNMLQRPIKLALVKEGDLLRALDLMYRRTEEISSFAEELDKELGTPSFELSDLASGQGQIDAPVIKLLQSLFEDAVQVNASDIHIEPDEKILRIRLRIDGVLHEQIVKEKSISPALASRLKIMAGLNIAEKRLPQDGRFNIRVRNRVIDVRLSTLPTQYGESVVMRLLDQSAGILNLDQVGMPESVLKEFRKLLKSPHGIILVTGPTGSGKTTTLYGALNELNEEGKKIITVEDPIEYRLPRINQVQVNHALDLDFVRILRTVLRQDPDIILVGEMRDKETTSVAIRAALTGHLVLSTLHTNDSASSAMRLTDMEVEGFLVAATLRGVLAQRLVRRICEKCKEPYQLSDVEKIWVENIKGEKTQLSEFYHGMGCVFCNQTGYKGRIGVFELLELDASMMEALRINDPTEFFKLVSEKLKGHLLADNALKEAEAGTTTVSEAMRIAGEI